MDFENCWRGSTQVLGFMFVVVAGSLLATTCAADEISDAIRDLTAEESPVRFNAARTLRRLAPTDAASITALVNALGDGGAPFENALQYFGPCVRDVAADALARIREPAIPSLTATLNDHNSSKRGAAASTLAEIGPRAIAAFKKLHELTKDPEHFVRWDAIRALAQVRPDSGETVHVLKGIYNDAEDQFERAEALKALVFADSDGELAIPILIEALDSGDGEIVSSAALTLAQYGQSSQIAYDKLVTLLDTDLQRGDAYYDVGWIAPVRRDIVQTLVEIRSTDASIVDHLNAINQNDEDYETRKWAAAALFQIASSQKAADLAFQFLVDSAACKQLAAIGSEKAISALFEMLKTEDLSEWDSLHLEVIDALGSCGSSAAIAVPLLIEIATGIDQETGYLKRLAAIEALGKIGPDAAAAIPVLERIRDTPADEWLEWRVSDLAEKSLSLIQRRAFP